MINIRTFISCLCLGSIVLCGSVANAATAKASNQAKKGSSKQSLPVPRLDSRIPPSQQALDAQIKKGVDFLLSYQNKDGSWGNATMTKGLNVLCPVPSGHDAFRAAVTSLDVMGLYACAPENSKVAEALDKAEVWLLENLPKLRRTSTDTLLNFWGHAYGIRALCALSHRVSPESETYGKLKKECQNQIDRLMAGSDAKGGWGYYEFDTTNIRPTGLTTSFCTATALIALKDAEKTFGLQGDKKIVNKAVKFLASQRTPDGTYYYSADHYRSPHGLINRQTGSLARSPSCNAALYMWGEKSITKKQVEDSLDWLWSRGGWLDMARKRPVPHEGWAANAGYFFYYGYFYASMDLSILDEPKRARHASFLAHTILPLQEEDGSWWDYPLYNYHKPYGTGYALFALSEAKKALEKKS